MLFGNGFIFYCIYARIRVSRHLEREENMKKKIAIIIGMATIIGVVIALYVYYMRFMKDSDTTKTITSAELVKAINISQLSTAEFVYNGIAEKYAEDNPQNIICHISYNANVKVGINMEEVEFQIDESKKTILPILPNIEIQVATLDEEEISYIPKNPDIPLKEVIAICKEDVMNEAKNSEKLYYLAEDNLKSVITALLSPILDSAEYTLVWE